MEKKYVTTKKECEKRMGSNVCDYCGRRLVAIKTVNNAGEPTYWSGCYHGNDENGWGVYTGGTTKEIFEMAQEYILRYGVISYNQDKDIKSYKENQLHKAVGIITQVLGLQSSNDNVSYRFKDWQEFESINKFKK